MESQPSLEFFSENKHMCLVYVAKNTLYTIYGKPANMMNQLMVSSTPYTWSLVQLWGMEIHRNAAVNRWLFTIKYAACMENVKLHIEFTRVWMPVEIIFNKCI